MWYTTYNQHHIYYTAFRNISSDNSRNANWNATSKITTTYTFVTKKFLAEIYCIHTQTMMPKDVDIFLILAVLNVRISLFSFYCNLNMILSHLIIPVLWTRRNFIIFAQRTLIHTIDYCKQCTKLRCHVIEIYWCEIAFLRS